VSFNKSGVLVESTVSAAVSGGVLKFPLAAVGHMQEGVLAGIDAEDLLPLQALQLISAQQLKPRGEFVD
jgi:hypothetical protein